MAIAATSNVRVLLVEDSVDHQLLTTRALTRAGIEVAVVGSGEEALTTLAGAPQGFDLVLIDVGLPMMSGMELLARIVELEDGPAAVMVTASEQSELIVAAMRQGAIDFVSKGAGYLEILPTVVRRAWSQYDLRRRTRELQRLALLVHQSTGLQETVTEVVAGACRLLQSPAAVLLLEKPETSGAWRTAARFGPEEQLPDAVARRLASATHEGVTDQDGMLAVRLPVELDERTGVLVVARAPNVPWLHEDLQLARTFAAYVASALRHVRRAELEGGLIEELQHTIRVRRDFVASVSHELRTPLTSIGGYAETILGRADQLSPDQLLDLVGRIRRNASELERMIDQLIDVARLERGTRFTFVPVELSLPDAIRATLEDVAPLLGGLDVHVAVPPLRVSADRELLHRVLVNLMTNAVKYSPDAGVVEVTAALRDDLVYVEVRDRGIGVDAADAQLIFQPFWRARYAVAQAVRGAGIGLALVREYVTGMGGEVGVRPPDDGPGSVFWFTLPVVR